MDYKKIAIIHGIDEKDRNIKAGQIEKYGEFEENVLHMEYLLDYVKEKYADKPIFQGFNIHHQKEALAYVLTEFFDKTIFFNTTRYKEDGKTTKYGYTGLFMLPKEINQTLAEALISFAKEIEKYEIMIYYDFNLEDGFINQKNLLTEKNATNEEKMIQAINTITNKKQNVAAY